MGDSRTDEQLAELWKAGVGRQRDEVFEVLFARYAHRLAALFRRLRFSDQVCQDLVQETFVSVLGSLERFRAEATFRTWLFQVARNAARKHIRRQRTIKRSAPTLSLDEVGPPTIADSEAVDLPAPVGLAGPFEHLLQSEQWRRLEQAVHALPQEDQQMVRFRLVQGLSVKETATLMRLPEGTVKSRWFRIRAGLRQALAQERE